MAITCVILDADNTLYATKKASELGYIALFHYLSSKTGIAEDKLRKGFSAAIAKVKEEHSPEKRKREYSLQIVLQKFFKDDYKIIPEALEHFWEVVVKNLEPAPKVKEVISYLHAKYTLVVASDEFQKSLIVKLQHVVGSLSPFSMIVTPEITKEMKPSPRYYEVILEELALTPNTCAVVGDRWIHDLEPAKQLGMRTVLVNTEKTGAPDWWIPSLEKLLTIL